MTRYKLTREPSTMNPDHMMYRLYREEECMLTDGKIWRYLESHSDLAVARRRLERLVTGDVEQEEVLDIVEGK